MKSYVETYGFIMWAAALVATAGSLFFSEVLGYEPCEFCWYQRILMYPLVIVYGVSLWKKNLDIALPGLFLSGGGILVSLYHYGMQKVPALSDGGACGVVPCSGQYINYFGFITIPFLAGAAFIIIFTIHMILVRKKRSLES
ncbi:disulfide bond formation protein B [Halobacillus yeomjeoni]|uniref:disulfide oxidoreductase n=1 Tax=Halobacillus yeomjeoni TaxID=311194 RepID=UPI001CD25420|nr:disulfide oxidoreductase [Halobacillus yeomjeoni]MCA0983875.1 disulfide bond formation protein B [Halobacillus yeomjeoni]